MSNIVQIKNPRSGKYIKIDRSLGKILSHKQTAGAYKGIPIVESKAAKAMKELNWSYDKRHTQWWCNHSSSISYTIEKKHGGWCLCGDNYQHIAYLDKLKNAKEVARLLAFG